MTREARYLKNGRYSVHDGRPVTFVDGRWDGPVPDEHKGWFHSWGQRLDDEGRAGWPVALIEREDGTVIEVPPEKVRFLRPGQGCMTDE